MDPYAKYVILYTPYIHVYSNSVILIFMFYSGSIIEKADFELQVDYLS